jgi:hypothetical protein
MRHPSSVSLSTLAACGAAAFFLVASIGLSSNGVLAHETKRKAASPAPSCPCDATGPAATAPATPAPETQPSPWAAPKLSDAKATLDIDDEIATLEALHMTLAEMGDGITYVWHRGHGRLSGAFQPTSSFKDANGRVCRHVVMILASGTYSRKSEGIACRLDNGVWQLEG